MTEQTLTVERPHVGWLVAVAGAIVIGALAGAFGMKIFVLLGALAAIVAAARRPLEATLITALCAPLNNVVVVHVPNLMDLRLTQILWLTILLSVLMRLVVRKPVPLVAPPHFLTLGLAGLIGWHTLSWLLNGHALRPLVEVAQLTGFCIIMWLVAASFMALPAEERARYVRRAGVATVALLGFATVYWLLQLQWPYLVSISPSDVRFLPQNFGVQEAQSTQTILTRITGFDLTSVTLAALMASVLGVGLAAGMTAKDGGDRRLGWAVFGASTVVLLLTYSRAGWAIGALVVLLIAWRIGKREFLAVGAVFMVAAALLLLVPQVRGRLAEFADPNETSTAIHFQLWRTAAGFANESPILGGGPYSFVERTRNMVDAADEPAHSFFFEAAADTGWVGAAYVSALTLAILGYAWRRLKGASVLEFSLWTGLFATVAMNLTMNGFREDMWWVWGGLAIAVAGTHAVAPRRQGAA